MSRRQRFRAVFAAIAVLLVVVGDRAAAVERSLSDPGPTSTIRGIVKSVDPPFGFVLEDGTVVELEAGAQWDGLRGVADLVPGDSITVIGKLFEIGGSPAVKAGGVRVASPSGRVVPIGSPVCMPPRLILSGGRKSSRAAPANLTTAKEEFEIEGVVVSVAEESFLLNGEDSDRYTVVVNEDTEFKDLDGLADLEDGRHRSGPRRARWDGHHGVARRAPGGR